MKVLPGSCQNLSHQDYGMGFRNGPVSLHPGLLSPSTLGVLLCLWKLPGELARLSKGEIPGSRLPDLPRIATCHPAQACMNTKSLNLDHVHRNSEKQCSHVTGNQSSNQHRWGMWMTPFPQPGTFSNFRPWMRSQGGYDPKITEVKFPVR